MSPPDHLPSAPHGTRTGRRWFLLGTVALVAGLLAAAAAVVVPDAVLDRGAYGRWSRVAGPAPPSSMSLPDEFAGWRRASGAGVRIRENDPLGFLSKKPEDPAEFYSDAVYREYRRGQAVFAVLHLTTVGEFRATSARSPAYAAHYFMADTVENPSTMPVENPSQGLVCGVVEDATTKDRALVCNYYEADSLMTVGIYGTDLDRTGAARLIRQLAAVASTD